MNIAEPYIEMEVNNERDNGNDLFLLETSGFSMRPFLKGGERVIIKKIPIEILSIGDIILYQRNDRIICHRLIKKNKDKQGWMLYARGDNSLGFEFITEQMFLGRVTGILRNNRFINLNTTVQRFLSRFMVIIYPWISISLLKAIFYYNLRFKLSKMKACLYDSNKVKKVRRV